MYTDIKLRKKWNLQSSILESPWNGLIASIRLVTSYQGGNDITRLSCFAWPGSTILTVRAAKRICVRAATPCSKFHQQFIRNFFVWKCFTQLFSSYILALNFFGAKILVPKVRIKYWWIWHLVQIDSRLEMEAHRKLHLHSPHDQLALQQFSLKRKQHDGQFNIGSNVHIKAYVTHNFFTRTLKINWDIKKILSHRF